ncbi:MAG: class I SAM-dependent RNA methyltransferase [Bdellovibrionales bacterium]
MPIFQSADEICSFFLIIPPGCENLALKELQAVAKKENVTLQKPKEEFGGISFESSFEFGLKLNLQLKIPSRILLRLTEFSSRDTVKFYNKLKKFDWRKLIPHGPIRWNISAAKSRLMVERKLEETCGYAYKEYCEGFPEKKAVDGFSPEVFIRLFEDQCTVSLDTSGERLHKRGYRTNVSHAPLRETLAAILWKYLKGSDSLQEPVTLIDPMAGSGTLLFEALFENLTLHMRGFAYEHFTNCPEKLKAHNWKTLVDAGWPTGIQSLKAYDRDPKMKETFQANLQEIQKYFERLKKAKIPGSVETLTLLNERISFEQKDLFESSSEISSERRWVLCNPPYGERLEAEPENSRYFAKLLGQIEKNYSPERIGILLPERSETHQLSDPKTWSSTDWKVVTKVKLKNGGIPILFYRFDRP